VPGPERLLDVGELPPDEARLVERDAVAAHEPLQRWYQSCTERVRNPHAW
jgi:hypothetical protein